MLLLASALVAGQPVLAQTGGSGGDRDALMALHAATGGEFWFNDTNWGSAEELDAWYGVGTDAGGRVTNLQLDQNNLEGELPKALGDLAMLKSLDLSDNRLAGPVPAEFAGLIRLESLDLSRNQMEGPIPPGVGGLERLERLLLGVNRLTGGIPEELSGLGALQQLDLGENRLFGGIPASLGKLRSLRHLDVRVNSLTGEIPARLGEIGPLEHLDLSENGLTGGIPKELGMLRNLRALNLSFNLLRGALPHELGRLVELERLQLVDNALIGQLPPELGQLKQLKWLSVAGNLFEGAIPAWLADRDQMHILNLSKNRFTGEIPSWLGYMSGLSTLELSDNDLSGEIPTELGLLDQMLYMGFAHNRLVGRLPQSLTNMLRIQQLNVGGQGLCIGRDESDLKRWLRAIPTLHGRLANCRNPEPVYLVQSVQSFETPTTLVAGRPALLRVFLASEEAAGEAIPPVEATFHDAEGKVLYQVAIKAGGRVRPRIAEGFLDASANAKIPGRVIRPGVEMTVKVRGDLPGLPSRIPAHGRIALDVEKLPPLHLTLVPLVAPGDSGSVVQFVDAIVRQGAEHPMLQPMLTMLPVERIEVKAHEPITTSSSGTFEMLRVVTAARKMEAGTGYWQGLRGPGPDARGQGLAWWDGWSSYSDPQGLIMAHELAHSMALSHTPCGSASGPDPSYPHARARIEAWGYNARFGILVPPTAYDNLSYCRPRWISEYSFSRALHQRLRREERGEPPRDGAIGRASRETEPVLLLWGGVDESGEPYLRPSFLVDAVADLPPPGDEYEVSGRTADGMAFSLTFDMPLIPDALDERAFVITLPVTWSGDLESIRLTGRGKAATIDLDTVDPMTILRDPANGTVRAVLARPAADAVRQVPDVPVEVFESFGVAIQ